MEKEKRQWSKELKLQFIQEAEVNVLQATLRKYNLSQSLFHKWKRTFNEQGAMGLEPAVFKSWSWETKDGTENQTTSGTGRRT